MFRLLAVLAFFFSWLRAGAAEFAVRDGETVLFLGDSNTYADHHVQYFETYLFTRFPQARFQVINRGMPSETAAGTSEPSHIPPRPNVHDRFSGVISNTKPSIVIASYGMNDGIYLSPNPETFAKYQVGINRLIERVQKEANARLVLVTPPPFDARPFANRPEIKPADYRRPASDYDDALTEFSEWLKTLGPRVQSVIDIHSPIAAVLRERRENQVDFKFAGDGIHIDQTGHMIWALEVLEALGAPAEIGRWKADATVKIHRKSLPMPMPHDPKWDGACVSLARFDERLNRLPLEFTQPSAKPLSASLMAAGSNLRASLEIPAGSREIDLFPAYLRLVSARAQDVLRRVQTRRALMLELWVRDDPHPRLNGMHKETKASQEQIDKLEQEIRELCRPVELSLTLSPLGSAK